MTKPSCRAHACATLLARAAVKMRSRPPATLLHSDVRTPDILRTSGVDEYALIRLGESGDRHGGGSAEFLGHFFGDSNTDGERYLYLPQNKNGVPNGFATFGGHDQSEPDVLDLARFVFRLFGRAIGLANRRQQTMWPAGRVLSSREPTAIWHRPAAYRRNPWWTSAILSWGALHDNVNRQVALGIAQQSKSKTNGSNVSFAGEVGYDLAISFGNALAAPALAYKASGHAAVTARIGQNNATVYAAQVGVDVALNPQAVTTR